MHIVNVTIRPCKPLVMVQLLVAVPDWVWYRPVALYIKPHPYNIQYATRRHYRYKKIPLSKTTNARLKKGVLRSTRKILASRKMENRRCISGLLLLDVSFLRSATEISPGNSRLYENG